MIRNSGNLCELCIIPAGCWEHIGIIIMHSLLIVSALKYFQRERRKRIEDVMVCFEHNALRVAVQIINISEALLIPRWASISLTIIIKTTTTIEGINFDWFWHKCARSHENLLAHEILIANSDKKGWNWSSRINSCEWKSSTLKFCCCTSRVYDLAHLNRINLLDFEGFYERKMR